MVAQYFYLGKINEHLFFDTSNSISRLVSEGLLPNNPALVLLWLLISISGLSHGVIATVIHVFINFTFHHLFIGRLGGTATPVSRTRGAERLREDGMTPTGSKGIICNLFFFFFFRVSYFGKRALVRPLLDD